MTEFGASKTIFFGPHLYEYVCTALRFRDLRESTIRTGARDDLPQRPAHSHGPPATTQHQEVVMSLRNGRLAVSRDL